MAWWWLHWSRDGWLLVYMLPAASLLLLLSLPELVEREKDGLQDLPMRLPSLPFRYRPRPSDLLRPGVPSAPLCSEERLNGIDADTGDRRVAVGCSGCVTRILVILVV